MMFMSNKKAGDLMLLSVVREIMNLSSLTIVF